MGLGGMIQEPWARFPVTEWIVFCHTARLQNRPPRLNLVLSDSTTHIERFSVSATDKDPYPRLYFDQLLHA